MVAPISPNRRRVLRRPVPHSCPNLGLSNYVERGVPGWGDWRRLRGIGTLSWLRWLWTALTMGALTEVELHWLTHDRMLTDRRCHIWDGMSWCFCKGPA